MQNGVVKHTTNSIMKVNSKAGYLRKYQIILSIHEPNQISYKSYVVYEIKDAYYLLLELLKGFSLSLSQFYTCIAHDNPYTFYGEMISSGHPVKIDIYNSQIPAYLVMMRNLAPRPTVTYALPLLTRTP